MQKIKLIKVFFIKPSASEVEKPEASEARESEGIPSELFNRLFFGRLWFVIKDVHLAVAHLHYIYMPGQQPRHLFRHFPALYFNISIITNLKLQYIFHMSHILGSYIYRHFGRYRHRVIGQEKSLQFFMPLLVVPHRAQYKLGQPIGKVGL